MSPTRRHIVIGAGAGIAGVAAAGGGWWLYQQHSLRVPQSLLVAGSGSMYRLTRALGDRFAKLHPDVALVVQSGGSLAGLLAVRHGTIDVAAMSRDLTEAEDTPNARSHLVALKEIAIVVHPASAVSGLDKAQLRSIFTGEITNWKAVGGPNATINVVSRLDGSSALRFLEEELLDGEEIAVNARTLAHGQQVAEAVAADKNAIGFMSMNEETKTPLRRLAIDGVLPTRATILSGRYPLTQPMHLVLYGKPSKAASDFVAFALSPEGQAIAKQVGFTAVG